MARKNSVDMADTPSRDPDQVVTMVQDVFTRLGLRTFFPSVRSVLVRAEGEFCSILYYARYMGTFLGT